MALTVILPSGLSNTGNFAVGSLSATGNLTGNYILGNGALLTGVITSVANINNGTSNVTVVSSGGNVTVGVGGTSNVAVFATTGEYVTGLLSVSGNINGANIVAGALLQAVTLSATGAVTFSGTTQDINLGTSLTTGNVIIGSTGTGFISFGGSTTSRTIYLANGVTGSGNTKTVSIGENGAAGSTTNVNIGPATATTAAGTVTFNTATTVVVANTSGTALSVAGNITGGNIITSGSGGNITGANVIAGTTLSATGNTIANNVIATTIVSAASHTGTIVSVTGNVTGSYFIGNGSQLTGIASGGSSNISNGTSNVTVVSSGGNVAVGIGGTSNVAVFATTGVYGTLFYATNAFYFNQSTIASSVVFPTGYNASTVGPMTQSPGVSVTVTAGSKWIVLG